ncbi:MAG TPA: hypothetical protein VNM92_04260 [Thermoanaerobaculia bacterium]|nr:hypothetical protein [Thermoanaerobaculia bacterium]
MSEFIEDLNRSVLFVLPREPFAAWARQDRDFAHTTLASLSEEGTAYLLPDVNNSGDEEALIAHFWEDIFELQLGSWSTDPSDWPSKRTLRMFREWFELKFSSLCLDLVGEPVKPRTDV